MGFRDDEGKRRLARSYLQMWDNIWEENHFDSEYNMPARILKEIFSKIDTNIEDMEDFRQGFRTIQVSQI